MLCQTCGRPFDAGPAAGVVEQLRRHMDRWSYDATEVFFATCPNCGTRQIAEERRFFFSLLGARQAWNVVRAIPVVILVLLLYVLLTSSNLFR